MKIFCEYCGASFDDTQTVCPHCGAANKGVARSVKEQPVTIEQLKQWYVERGLPPYETTRFFIGEDYKGKRAFGIYKDDHSGNFVVYKNKDDGSRAVRYEGTDEAYAVNELYMRLKQEILQQKSNNLKSTGSVSGNSSSGSSPTSLRKFFVSIFLFVAVCMIINSVLTALFDNTHKNGYYNYSGSNYYCDNDNWYYYDTYDNDWYECNNNDVPWELSDEDKCKDFYYTPNWNSATQMSDFKNTEFYEENHSSDSSSDNWSSDSDYSWDSGDSWSSDSGDWSSDW